MEDGIKFGKANKGTVEEIFNEVGSLPLLILFTEEKKMKDNTSQQFQLTMNRYLSRLRIWILGVGDEGIPSDFGIETLPTLVYFRDRNVIERKIGICSQKLLESWTQHLLKRKSLSEDSKLSKNHD